MQNIAGGLICVHINDIALKNSSIIDINNLFSYKSLVRKKILQYIEKGKYVGLTGYIRPIELDFLSDLKGKIDYIDFLDNRNFVDLQGEYIKQICIKRNIQILEIIGGYKTGCLSGTVRNILKIQAGNSNKNIPPEILENKKMEKMINSKDIEIFSNPENEIIKTCIVNNRLVF